MVLRSSVIIAALLGLYFFKMTEPTVVVNDKEALILQGLMQTIEYGHFAPKKVDDAFSQTIYKTYLERIDGQKRFFTQQDIDKIKPFELKMCIRDRASSDHSFAILSSLKSAVPLYNILLVTNLSVSGFGVCSVYNITGLFTASIFLIFNHSKHQN